MKAHYLLVLFHTNMNTRLGEVKFHNFQADSEDEVWEYIDHYMTEQGIVVVDAIGLNAYPTETALAVGLRETIETMAASGFAPHAVTVRHNRQVIGYVTAQRLAH